MKLAGALLSDFEIAELAEDGISLEKQTYEEGTQVTVLQVLDKVVPRFPTSVKLLCLVEDCTLAVIPSHFIRIEEDDEMEMQRVFTKAIMMTILCHASMRATGETVKRFRDTFDSERYFADNLSELILERCGY